MAGAVAPAAPPAAPAGLVLVASRSGTGDVPVASRVCAADGGPALVVRPVGPFELWCCAAAHVRSVSGGDLEVRQLPFAPSPSCSVLC